MSQQIWMRADIINLLVGLNATSGAMATFADADPEAAAYRHGFRDGLAAVAVALGAKPTAVEPDAGARQLARGGDV